MMHLEVYSLFGILVLTYLFLCSSAGSVDEGCKVGLPYTTVAKVHRSNCYQFVNTEKYWDDARDYCLQNGGKLVTIDNDDTQNFIKSTLNSLSWTNNGVWIGLHDRVAEMSFEWVTTDKYVGRVMTYTNWAHGHPKAFFHGARDCVQMRRKSHWKWHESYCHFAKFQYKFICQYAIETVIHVHVPPTTTNPPQHALQNQNQLHTKPELVNNHTQAGIKVPDIMITASNLNFIDEKIFDEIESDISSTEKKVNDKKTQDQNNLLVQITPKKESYKKVEPIQLSDDEDTQFIRKMEVKNYYGEHEAHALSMQKIEREDETGEARHVLIGITFGSLFLVILLIVLLVFRRRRRNSKPVVVIAEEISKGDKYIPKKPAENEYVVNIYSNPMPSNKKIAKLPDIGSDDDDDGYMQSVNTKDGELIDFIEEEQNLKNTNDDVEENLYYFIPEETDIDPIYESLDDIKCNS